MPGTSKVTGNHGHLRQQNLSGVFSHLYENAPISRIELARMTGLNKATVSSLIGELIKNNFVIEIGEGNDHRAGRRKVLLGINPKRGHIVSAELGVGFISILCADFGAKVIWKHRETTHDFQPAAMLNKTIKLLQKAQSIGEKKAGSLQGIAVGLPGLIDQETGMLLFAPNLGWREVDVMGLLQKNFSVPVHLGNEATFAALGENYFGAARGTRNVLYISVGIGIGGGLIVDGDLYNGTSGAAGEFGHMTIDPGGSRCACGNFGCWETFASQAALFRFVRNAIEAGRSSVVADLSNGDSGGLSILSIIDAAKANDSVALEALEITGHYLGIGIDTLIKAFDPEMVILGGRLSLASEFLLPAIKNELTKRSMFGRMQETPVISTHFGAEAAVMGGVAKVFQSILENPGT